MGRLKERLFPHVHSDPLPPPFARRVGRDIASGEQVPAAPTRGQQVAKA
jgi:hypothetical protein